MLINRRKVKEFALETAKQRAHKFTRVGSDFLVKCETNLKEFIRIGFDTPKLASALIGGKMTDGKLLHPQESQCIGADVSLGLCREISPGGDE